MLSNALHFPLEGWVMLATSLLVTLLNRYVVILSHGQYITVNVTSH